MRAFHNDPAIKAKYVNRMAAHIAADELIHGVGWEDGKGCAVGCTFDAYDHSLGPIELGLPEWLMRLVDVIYEQSPNGEAMDFVAKFLVVIPVGADVEPVKYRLAIRRIDRLLAIQRAAIEQHSGDVQAAIKQTIAALEIVRRCHEAAVGGNVCDWSAAESAAWSAELAAAESAAESADLAARSAARSAAWSAAKSAARSAHSAAESAELAADLAAESAAESAESAVDSAAESAVDSAAESAARSAAWKQEADDLLELLAAA